MEARAHRREGIAMSGTIVRSRADLEGEGDLLGTEFGLGQRTGAWMKKPGRRRERFRRVLRAWYSNGESRRGAADGGRPERG
jgi:hypothetical protein